MIAIPAIELRGGACMYGGNGANLQDPLAVTQELVRCGFKRLHIVDLDAAAGTGVNESTLRALLRETAMHIQLAGGVQSTDRVEELLDLGVDWVVVGIHGTEDQHWLAELTSRHPHRLFVRMAVQGRRVAGRGWAPILPPNAVDLAEELNPYPIAGVLLQPAHRIGDAWPDLSLLEDVVEAAHYPVAAIGSSTPSIADLRAMGDRGAAAALIRAPIDAALDPGILAMEFGE